MTEDKLLKARLIVAKLIAHLVFKDWENLKRGYVLDLVTHINEKLSLGINPASVVNTMLEHRIIHCNGSYEGEPIYSLKERKEPIHL